MIKLSALSALLLLGACATATPYQAATDSSRGYTNQQIETNRWQVGFSGNSLTERETVETYLLYRAAELTRQQGFDHFRVVRRETDEDSRLVATGFSQSPFYSGFYCNYRFYSPAGLHHPAFYRSRLAGYHDPFGYGFGASDYREITRYEASAEIMMGHGDKPADNAEYFDAADVLANLGPRILRPETEA
ncbi:MAG: hypothetical protein MRY64_10345 [Hyphomonadaceae bacterium]|nr:hypothetical protein [Hyphomonadaceae bacterium]